MPLLIKKRNLTISLTPETIGKAKLVAAKHSISLSDLVAEQIENIIQAEEARKQAARLAPKILDRGFQMTNYLSSATNVLRER